MSLTPYSAIARGLLAEEFPTIRLEPGSRLSFPVPALRGGCLLEAFFVTLPPNNDEAGEGPRPYAWGMTSAADGRPELFSRCAAMDFISTDHYPLDETISLELPKRLSRKRYEALSQELLECYEQLRPFVFEEQLSKAEVQTVVVYKELFLRLVYEGHYPFYHALSPEFFHWLRLPLPKLKTGPHLVDAAAAGTKEYQCQLIILENLQQLVRQFQEKIAVDAHKEKLFDQLHQELQQHKNGLLDSLTRSMELDVIQLIDAMRKTLKVWREKPASEENCHRLFALLEGVETDLCDLLYRHGVEPYTVPSAHVEISRQKVVSTVPTGEEGQDRQIARRLACGWEKEGKTVRPERVSVYLYTPEKKDELPLK